MINTVRIDFRTNNFNMFDQNTMNLAKDFDDSADSRYATLPHYWSIL